MTRPSASPSPEHERFFAIPEARRFHELIAGEIVEKAAPSGEHADAQGAVVAHLRTLFHGPGPSEGDEGPPGGWWIYPESELMLASGEIVRPDVAGWRRDTTAVRPTGTPIAERPDWVCEVVPPSNANRDTVAKLRLYHRAEIPFYWIVDPRDATLTVFRWSADGYVSRLRAESGEVVSPEPFEARSLAVASLFGDDA